QGAQAAGSPAAHRHRAPLPARLPRTPGEVRARSTRTACADQRRGPHRSRTAGPARARHPAHAGRRPRVHRSPRTLAATRSRVTGPSGRVWAPTTIGPVTLRTSPLDAAHRALGAKLVEFGGWDMPLSYPSGTLAEHRACRADAVVFDV